MQVESISTSIPFLSLKGKEKATVVVRVVARATVEVRKEARAVVVCDVYGMFDGVTSLSTESLKSALASNPTRMNVGLNDSVRSAIFPDGTDKPVGEFFILTFMGKQDLAGGRTWNNWSIGKITLSETERKSVPIQPN